MIPFRLRRNGDKLVIQRQGTTSLVDRDGWHSVPSATWQTVITLDRVWAANLAAELDAWLTGTDQLPEA